MRRSRRLRTAALALGTVALLASGCDPGDGDRDSFTANDDGEDRRASTTVPPQSRLDENAPLGLGRLGPIEIGMPVVEASSRAPSPLNRAPDAPERPDCNILAATGDGVPGVRFMVRNDRISRIDVISGPIATVDGIRIGSTRDDIQRTYTSRNQSVRFEEGEGGIRRAFVEGREDDRNVVIVMELRDEKVVTLRTGFEDELELSCSVGAPAP